MSFSRSETGKDSAQMSAVGITGSAEPTPSDGRREPETIPISLPALRSVILGVIDDGDLGFGSEPQVRHLPWELWHPYQPTANDNRLRFCDEIENRLRQLPAQG